MTNSDLLEAVEKINKEHEERDRIKKENATLKKELEVFKKNRDEILNEIDRIKTIVFQDKSWVRLPEYHKLKEENEQLKQQIEKMKCCENCKYHSFWGDELKCNFLDYDAGFDCLKSKSKWELAE